MINLSAGLLVLSGFAALIYQVVWVRLLSLSMGSTSAAVSTILAAFFLGLALGSYLAEWISRRRANNLSTFIRLEAIIGISGVLLLPLLLHLDHLMALVPGVGTLMPAKFLLCLLILLVPTLCMGATYPVMASALIRRQGEMGSQIGRFYALNTAGAVLGAGFSGFLLIPNLGLDGTVYFAAALNLSVVLLGLYLNPRLDLSPVEPQGEASDTQYPGSDLSQRTVHRQALVVLFGTGFVAIATEVGWTKYLAIFTGTTIYGFAAILTVFLTGIALGSWAIKRYLSRIRSPLLWMSWGLVLLGASLLLARIGLAQLPVIWDGLDLRDSAAHVQHPVKYGLVFLMLFPATFVFGGLFPISLSLYCTRVSNLRHRIGRGYAVNTLGSILGALAAGFWIIPAYGTNVLLNSLAVMILLLPLLFVGGIEIRIRQTAILAASILLL